MEMKWDEACQYFAIIIIIIIKIIIPSQFSLSLCVIL